MIAEHSDGKPTVRMVAERESSRQEQRGPTARQIQFAQLVAAGLSQAGAYRRVFHPIAKPRRAAERGCRMAALPSVAAEIARIRERSERKTLLTLNDRLEILANVAQKPESKDCDKIRAIDVYLGWAGDLAPDRQEISGPGGGSIPIKDESSITPSSALPSVTESSCSSRGAKRRQQIWPRCHRIAQRNRLSKKPMIRNRPGWCLRPKLR